MKNWKTTLLIVMTALAVAAAPALAAKDDPKAREIMQKVNDRDDGDNAVSDQEMVLIDKRGNQRVREIRSFTKDYGEDTHSILFFLEPTDVKNTSFLTYDYDEANKDDDQWLYLPALKKVKRIASSDKDGAFMGSDFTYGDMTKRELPLYTFQLVTEQEVRGKPCWVIKSTPINDDVIDKYGYTDSLVWVQKDNYMVVRGKFNVKKGKKTKYLDVVEQKLIDGVWVGTRTTMTTKKGKKTKHSTLLLYKDVKFNQDLDDTMFSTVRMTQGL